jgi:hypothetical protein
MNFSINQNAPFIRTPPFFSADIDLVQMDSLYILFARHAIDYYAHYTSSWVEK